MRNISGSLSEDEVRLIARLSDSLDRSSVDFLQVEAGTLRVSLAKDCLPAALAPATESVAAHVSAQVVHGDHAENDGTVAVKAPLIGFYYLRTESAAFPFVTKGAAVGEATTVGVISLMDVLKPVPAGISGIITEVCVENAQFVEYGQVLCRIRPDPANLCLVRQRS